MKNKNKKEEPINKYIGNKEADEKYIKELMERRRRAFYEENWCLKFQQESLILIVWKIRTSLPTPSTFPSSLLRLWL